LLTPSFLHAQIDEDFNLGDISELVNWSGDLDHFIISEEKQLQLSTDDGGVSTIVSKMIVNNQAEWELYFKMDFAPSNSNSLRIYLYADDVDLSKSNGYYFEIGETGSNDNLKFYRQDEGDARLLAQGVMSTLGDDPAEARIKVIKDGNGFWSIASAYDGEAFTQVEIELSDDTYELGEGYFAISCSYTSTRADKFFFDDIYVGSQREDLEAPKLINAQIISPTNIRLLFNELIEEASASALENYNIDIGIGNPINITFGAFNNELFLEFPSPLLDGLVYELSITSLSDLSGNLLSTTTELILSSQPTIGELLINEILFDPYPEGEDFIELYNNSNKYLDLSSLVISNLDNEQSTIITTPLILRPFQYLAITPDLDALFDLYFIRIPENIVEHSLPAFNNADGNVTLSIVGQNQPLDSYSYSEDDHSPWIDDTEGVSLERLDFDVGTDSQDNWQSASSKTGFATPGYENSNFTETTVLNDEFFLEKKTFSPDSDGFDDLLQINYRVSKPGFVLNMRVFDDRGHLVKTLASNEILGRQGEVLWNGENDEGSLSGIGIYIIFLEYFNSEGSLYQKKLSCVLAKQLE